MMNRHLVAILASLSVVLAATLAAADVPKITAFSPASGSAGDHVVVSGTGFQGVSSVKINGLSAAFVLDSARKITATVPANRRCNRSSPPWPVRRAQPGPPI